MILLTKLNGDVFALNPSFITRIEQHRDTIVFTRDGNDVMVQESLDNIVDQVRAWRLDEIAAGIAMATGATPPAAAGAGPMFAAVAAAAAVVAVTGDDAPATVLSTEETPAGDEVIDGGEPQ